MRRFQFRLKSMLAVVTLLCVVAAGYYWWHWWTTTRHMRNFSRAVAGSALDVQTKRLLTTLAWTPAAWETGLVRKLTGPFTTKQVVWRGQIPAGPSPYDVFLLDGFVRPVADTPVAPVCVVMDQQGRLRAWAEVATWSSGFLSASIDHQNVLTVTTFCNWFYGKGIYRYALRDDKIVPLDDGRFVKFEEPDPPQEPAMLTPDAIIEGWRRES